eukprot:403330701
MIDIDIETESDDDQDSILMQSIPQSEKNLQTNIKQEKPNFSVNDLFGCKNENLIGQKMRIKKVNSVVKKVFDSKIRKFVPIEEFDQNAGSVIKGNKIQKQEKQSTEKIRDQDIDLIIEKTHESEDETLYVPSSAQNLSPKKLAQEAKDLSIVRSSLDQASTQSQYTLSQLQGPFQSHSKKQTIQKQNPQYMGDIYLNPDSIDVELDLSDDTDSETINQNKLQKLSYQMETRSKKRKIKQEEKSEDLYIKNIVQNSIRNENAQQFQQQQMFSQMNNQQQFPQQQLTQFTQNSLLQQQTQFQQDSQNNLGTQINSNQMCQMMSQMMSQFFMTGMQQALSQNLQNTCSQQQNPQFFQNMQQQFCQMMSQFNNNYSTKTKMKDRNNMRNKDPYFTDWQYEKLYDYQREGVMWLFNNFKKKAGCIVADDMGLGKTIQISVFLGTLIDLRLVKDIIIVCPPTLIDYWIRTMNYWNSDFEQNESVIDVREKSSRLKKISRAKQRHPDQPLVIVISPKVFEKESEVLCELLIVDVMVIDEGHRAKNIKTKFRKSIKEFQVKTMKIVLSGTPIQNNLLELYSLYDLVYDNIFGSQSDFNRIYAKPIEEGCKKTEDERVIRRALEQAKELKDKYEKFFLRRVKKQIFQLRSAELNPIQEKELVLPLKTDLVVWVTMSKMQNDIYQQIIDHKLTQTARKLTRIDPTEKALRSRKVLGIITVLRWLCVHPFLTFHHYMPSTPKPGSLVNTYLKKGKNKEYQQALQQEIERERQEYLRSMQISKEDQNEVNKSLDIEKLYKAIVQQYNIRKYGDWFFQSNKIQLLFLMLQEMYSKGHKVLIFSKSINLLDMIEHIIIERYPHFNHERLDGSVVNSERDKVCEDFNNPQNGSFCFLLSYPDWNPATDNQCIDRLYRIGQLKDVIVYRLITAGSVEEHMYRRQVYKSGISHAVIEKTYDKIQNYFDSESLTKLLDYDQNKKICETIDIIEKEHSFRVESTQSNRDTINFLRTCNLVVGITNHQDLYKNSENCGRPTSFKEEDCLEEDQETFLKQQLEKIRNSSKI